MLYLQQCLWKTLHSSLLSSRMAININSSKLGCPHGKHPPSAKILNIASIPGCPHGKSKFSNNSLTYLPKNQSKSLSHLSLHVGNLVHSQHCDLLQLHIHLHTNL